MVSLLDRKRRRTWIGLDVGSTGVRAVQLLRSSSAYTLSASAVHEGPTDGHGDDGGVRRLIERFAACRTSDGFRGRTAAVALNPPSVEFHSLELPSALVKTKSLETSQVVACEVARLRDAPGKSIEASHWALPPTQVVGSNAIGVAVESDVVAAMMKTCTESGFLCRRVDVGATALSRFGAILGPCASDEVWGLLDVGDTESRLVLCLDDVPILVRRAGSGGRRWTQRIAETLQLSISAAETHKRRHGLASMSRGMRHGSGSAPHGEIASLLLGALRSELTDLATEIKRSYEYALSCYPGRRAADLILVGGGAGMRNLPEFLSDALGIAVRRATEYLGGESCRLTPTGGDRIQLETLALAIGLAVDPNTV